MLRTSYLLLTCFLCTLLSGTEYIPSHQCALKFPKKGVPQEFLLITGCARSGTLYITEVLKFSGLDIGHECFGKDGCCSWTMAVDSDRSPYGPPTNSTYFIHTFHQVRNPLLVISSVYTTEPQESWEFICGKISEMHCDDTHLMRCAKYWYYWNLAAEKKAEWTYKIEDLDAVYNEMSDRLNYWLDRDALEAVSRTTNHRGDYIHKFTWADLKKELPKELFNNIQKLAMRYGYPITD